MINDYREALQYIHAETKKGLRKATTTATTNQEAFSKFVVKKSNAFRDKKCHVPKEALSKERSSWRNIKVSAEDSGPKGLSSQKGPRRRPHPHISNTAKARADRAAHMRDGKISYVATRNVAQYAATPATSSATTSAI